MGVSVTDFVVGDQLGEGSFGTVSKCLQRSTKRTFAIKTIVIAQLDRMRYGYQQVMTEKKALIRLADPAAHPSIVQLHYTFRDADHLYLVLEYCRGGELFSQIRRLGSCHIDCARWLTAELVKSLEYLHSKQVLHRDLKPENILLDEEGHIKLIDFGSARLLDSTEDFESFVGTAEYVSPEVLDDKEACEASDFWALGCILYQMLSGAPPFQGDSQYLTFEKIKLLEFSRPEALETMLPQAKDLILGLLHPNPDERLGAPSAGGPAALQEWPFFTAVSPPIDFDAIFVQPPPPLVPPPPMPSIEGDSVFNSDLAACTQPLSSADRQKLSAAQAGVRWASVLDPAAEELILLATTVVKRKGIFSAKRRQLILIEGTVGCRICYVDPATMEVKGSIPWSHHLHAEVAVKGNFKVHIPGRTYYLEDIDGDQAIAEQWVQTISTLQSRRASSASLSEDSSSFGEGLTPGRNWAASMDSFRSQDDEPSFRPPSVSRNSSREESRVPPSSPPGRAAPSASVDVS